MTTEIERRGQQPAGTIEHQHRLPVALDKPIMDLDEVWRLSVILSQTTMVPAALRNNPGNVMVLVMTGQELGLTWNQALRMVYVTKGGQPGLRGELLLMRIRSAGHDYDYSEPNAERCSFRLHRDHKAPVDGFENKPCGKGNDYFGHFTVADAESAGLCAVTDGKIRARSQSGAPLPWEQYGSDMLFWRAVGRATRRGCPEVTMGLPVSRTGDEDADNGPDGPVVAGSVLPQARAEVVREGKAAADELRAQLAEDAVVAPAVADELREMDQAARESGYDDSAMFADPTTPAASTAGIPTEATPAGSPTAQRAADPSQHEPSGSYVRGRIGRKFRDAEFDDPAKRAFTSSVVIRRWITTSSEMTAPEAATLLTWLTDVVDHALAEGMHPALAIAEETENLRAVWEHDDPEQFEDEPEVPDE